MASVMSISGIFILTIIQAFSKPTIREAASAERIAMSGFCENHTNMEITIAFDNVATEPTDKSKPFTAREIVSPTAMMVTIEIDRKILMIFPDCKNAGLVSCKDNNQYDNR